MFLLEKEQKYRNTVLHSNFMIVARLFPCEYCSEPHYENWWERCESLLRGVNNAIYLVTRTDQFLRELQITNLEVFIRIKHMTDILWGVHNILRSVVERFSTRSQGLFLRVYYIRSGTYTISTRRILVTTIVSRILQDLVVIKDFINYRYIPSFLNVFHTIIYRVNRLLQQTLGLS